MSEKQSKLAFIEGPQGVGKTTAAEFAKTLGFRPIRGIPTREKLIVNTEIQNWTDSLRILDELAKEIIPIVTDRSLWSLVAFNMRKKPYTSDLIYNLGSNLLKRRVNGINHKVIIILSSADICLTRADPNNPISITDINEANQEIQTYLKLLERLKEDGFDVYEVCNSGITKKQFLEHIEDILMT